MRYLSFLAVFLLVACSQANQETDFDNVPLNEEEVEEEVMEEEEMDMEMMMHHTEALEEGCDALSAMSAEEKTEVLDEIGHNMDKDVLDMILGEECEFLGEVAEVATVSDEDLKMNPNDDETLYFSEEANRFFVTCRSMNTVAYVVERSNEDDPAEYFEEYRDKFAAAAKMAKDMMMEMGDMMDHEEEMMEEEEERKDEEDEEDEEKMMMDDGDEEEEEVMEEEETMEAKEGAYIEGSYENVEIATAAIGNGDPALLFFYASWCGYCQAKDGILTDMYNMHTYPVSTYKVDYDTATDLKAKYGIASQDTFVLVDGSGNAVKTVPGASKADIKGMISG